MDTPKPDETTGKTMLEHAAPTPDMPPLAPDTSPSADDDIITSTAVQGAPEDE